ncbi:hypothetical protein D3C77_428370 [compost metagenome]
MVKFLKPFSKAWNTPVAELPKLLGQSSVTSRTGKVIQVIALDLSLTHEIRYIALPGYREITGGRRMIVIEDPYHWSFDIQCHCYTVYTPTVKALEPQRHTAAAAEEVNHIQRLFRRYG